MNASYMYLNQTINTLVKTPADQGRIVAMAVAFAATAAAPLPSSPVDNPSSYYTMQVSPGVITSISALNEGVIFAANTAMELTHHFWRQRYYAAHPMSLIDDKLSLALDSVGAQQRLESFDFNAILNGGLVVLSVETAQFLNKYRVEIAKLIIAVAPHVKPVDAQANSQVGREF